uniref:Uncharacterized protein n=1 Tax=Romanomermis culicivorax TaxID=13658 RepID=A0A915KK66_ROMCU
VSSANNYRVCFIVWLKYKKFKANWAQCDECDGSTCGNCMMDDSKDEADFVRKIFIAQRDD